MSQNETGGTEKMPSAPPIPMAARPASASRPPEPIASRPPPGSMPPVSRPPPFTKKRTATLPGSTTPSSTDAVPTVGALPSSDRIPPPARLPSLDGPSSKPPADDAPPAIPMFSAPVAAASEPPPGRRSSPGDTGRRRSRRTVQMPADAVPAGSTAPLSTPTPSSSRASADGLERRSDVGDARTSDEDLLAQLPPPLEDVVITPMRIINVASDLPAMEPLPIQVVIASPPAASLIDDPVTVAADSVIEDPPTIAIDDPVTPSGSLIDDPVTIAADSVIEDPATVAPEAEPRRRSERPSDQGNVRVSERPQSGEPGDIEEIEPDRVSDPELDASAPSQRTQGGRAAKARNEARAAAAAPADASSTEPPRSAGRGAPPPAPSKRESSPEPPKVHAIESPLTEEVSVDVVETQPSSTRKPPPPPPKASRPAGGDVAPPSGAAGPSSQIETARKRQKPWWEELFGDDYIRTMDKLEQKSVQHETDFIEQSLGVEKGAVILDLACGAGAHAVELASRGYGVVGYDLSLAMLARAADEAQGRGQKLNFLQGDMREMGFEEMFDGVYCWSTSFGYFDDEKNFSVLQRVHRALRQGGMLLLDVINRDYVAPRSPSLVWFEGEGCVCMDDMHLDFFTSRLRVKRTAMFEDGRSRELDYSIRLYALHELGLLLHECGFKVIEVTGHPAHPGVFFGAESPRVIILAERS